MKRIVSSLLLLGSLANLAALSPVHAAGMPITTVKVTAYVLAKDGRMRPHGQGSATIVTPDGFLVTNHHVSVDGKEEPADAFEVCFSYSDALAKPECTATARYVSSDREHDIAVLKVDSTDIFGKGLPALPHLTYADSPRPVVGEEVQMVGYPDIGGSSATFTNGKVSGFLNIDGTEYFKSDAKISNGNSGGTALNKDGKYVGIPSRGETGSVSSETLGYILPIADYREWVTRTISSIKPADNQAADARLKSQMLQLYDANRTGKLEVDEAPAYSLLSAPGWRFSSNAASLNDYSQLGEFTLSSSDGKAYVSVSTSRETHEKSLDKLEKEQRKVDRYLRTIPGYSVRKAMLGGKYPALEITLRQREYLSEGSKYDRIDTEYRIPFGTSVVTVATSHDTSPTGTNASDVATILAGFSLDTTEEPSFTLVSYDGSEPDIDLTNPSPRQWKMVETRYFDRAPALSLLLERPDDDKSWIVATYGEYHQYETDGEYAKYFENEVKNAKEYSSLLSSGDDLRVAGRRAFFTLTKDTSVYNEDPHNPFVTLSIVIPDGKYYYTLALSSPSKQYASYVSFVKALSATIVIDGEKGKTDLSAISMLDGSFIDTANHRFEKAIGALKHEGIIGGYPDKTFRPYRAVSRAEFLKLVLSSMPQESQADLASYLDPASKGKLRGSLIFKDIHTEAWYARYVSYAVDKGIVKGYADGTLRPERPVTLAEGLKMLLTAHSLTVWQPIPGDGSAWELPFMDKAYELKILVEGMDKPSHQLLRGEVAHILHALREGDKDKYGL